LTESNNLRTQRRERTRKKILLSAVRIFAELGFDAASMGTIASRAGMKKALVQYHFETKLNLWQESVNLLWDEMHNLADGLPKLENCPSIELEHNQIREAFRAIIRFAKKHPDWVGIMFREAATPGPRLDWLVETHLKKDISDGIKFVTLAQSHDLLPAGSALHILHIISGALTYILLVAPLTKRATGVDLTVDDSLDTTVDMLLTMLNPAR
jgi:TetR/AcrR family transcriptional regulator